MIKVTNTPEVLLQDRLERIKKFVQDAVDAFLVGGEIFTSYKLEIIFMANGTLAVEKAPYNWKATIYGCAPIEKEISEFLQELKEAYLSAGFKISAERWQEGGDKLFRLIIYTI